MKKMRIIFVHGWGCGPDIWTSTVRHLEEFECRAIDLGFTSDHEDLGGHDREYCVYVTHSLGTMWVLQNRYAQIKALVAVNGFACFQSFSELRTLKSMKLNLKRNPESQMQAFWQKSNLQGSDYLNVERLSAGLDWLLHWNCCQQLRELTCPVYTVFGDDDPILNFQFMKDHWDGHRNHIIAGGGHNLPITHSQDCADLIREMVHAL